MVWVNVLVTLHEVPIVSYRFTFSIEFGNKVEALSCFSEPSLTDIESGGLWHKNERH